MVEPASGPRRARYSGTLASRPLAVLLAQASERKTSGVLSLTAGERHAAITLETGRVVRVTTSEPSPYLGAIVYELGFIDSSTLDRTLTQVASTGCLHGEVLLREGLITRTELDEALSEQTYRRLCTLFAWPESTAFALRDDADEMPEMRDAGRPAVDPWPAIWRGTAKHPPEGHIAKTLDRIEGEVQISDLGAALRLGLDERERALCERLARTPQSIREIMTSTPLGRSRTSALLWCIALGRALSASATRPAGPTELGIGGIRLRARQIVDEDPWTVLGLARGAPVEAARAAYFRLARQWQPDRLPRELAAAKQDCRTIFTALAEAHRAIRDASPETRASAEPPRRTLRDADDALARGDVGRAREIATSVARGGVHGPAARALAAWCDAGAGAADADQAKVADAIQALDRVLGGDPECVRALYYRAKLHELAGRIDVAIRDLRRVTRIAPQHAEAQRDLRSLTARTSGAPVSSVDDPAFGPGASSGLRRVAARVV